MEIIIQSIGWVGTILIVFAYFLVSSERLTAKDTLYQWMNLLGAISIGINVFHQQAWPAFALEIAWGIIAISSITKSKKS